MARNTTLREKILLLALVPLLILTLLLVLVGLPFYWAYRLLLRLAVEVFWGARGRRILLVYSRSPVWQQYIEANWLPRLCDHSIVLNWSDRANWKRGSFAVWVFRHWAPSRNFNPMTILFPRFRPSRTIGFYDAFRDWKHGKDHSLREAESRLFAFVDALQGPST